MLRRAEGFVLKSGLYPDVPSLVGEASVRYLMEVRRRDDLRIDEETRVLAQGLHGRRATLEVDMPDGVFSELESLMRLWDLDVFSVAVLEQMDRLYRIS